MKQKRRFPSRALAWGVRFLVVCVLCVAPVVSLNSCSGGQSLPMFADECARATNIDIPGFNCDNGTLVPETNENIVSGEVFCDRPNVLNHECDPGSRFQVVAQNADAIVVAHCRKQNQGVDANGDGLYGDIAVIQYNKSNGATCFYQALAANAGEPLKANVTAPVEGNGSDKFPWMTPRETADIKCVFCHDNGPFIRSPYLAQLSDPELNDAGPDPDSGLIHRLPGTSDDDDAGFGKTGWNLSQPYTFVGADFQDWKAYRISAANTTCTSCHRMGLATVNGDYSIDNSDFPQELGTSLKLGIIATATSQTHKNTHSDASPIWMKPDQTVFVPATELEAKAVHDCALAIAQEEPLPDGCSATLYAEGDQGTIAAQVSGASASSAQQFVQPPKVTGEGSCMCSFCWNQSFCYDPKRPEGQQVYPLPCDKPEDEAVDATRLIDAEAAKEGGFYCWKPFPDAVMNATSKSCPSDESARANVESFDVCIDAQVCARPVDQCGPHTEPACPEEPRTARPAACVEVPGYHGTSSAVTTDATNGANAVVSDLATKCAQFGDDPPNGPQPQRYCYLSCVNAHDCTLDTTSPSCIGCESTTKVQSVAGTFPVDMNPSSTTVSVFLKDLNGDFQEVGSMSTSGRIHFLVPEPCQGQEGQHTCDASVTRMALASVGTLTLGGMTLSNVRLINDNPAANLFTNDDTDGSVSIPAHTKFGMTGDVTGLPYRYMMLDPAVPIVTTWDWAARLVSLDVTLLSADGTIAVQLSGLGSFDSLPPTSVATASPAVVNCGQSTRLSALGSTDPDGASDIQSVTWTTDRTDSNEWQASGMTVDIFPEVGTHRYYATVVDSAGSTHTSFVDVTMRCSGCADSTAEELFSLGVVGCGGTATWDQRATLCSTGFAACSAAQWNAYRGNTIPVNDYWTNDNLQYAGNASACEAVYTGGTSCGTNRPMRVCTPDGTDGYGNTCTWTGCGLDTTDDEHFGGCVSNPTAGSLCCAQPVCANSATPTDVFTPGMIGCGGTKTWDQRATLCAAGYTPCTAAQWNAYRGSAVPSKNYWTNDNLQYSGSASACEAVYTGGTSCGTNRPMRVCTPGGTDSYGNTCTWTGCGLDTTDNDYFGGCVSNTTAGTLCCRP